MAQKLPELKYHQLKIGKASQLIQRQKTASVLCVSNLQAVVILTS